MKRSRLNRRNPERLRRLFKRQWHSTAFVRFVTSLPCVRCGLGPSEGHHEPTRGAGGTWHDVSPLCRDCHTRRHTVGAVTFWRDKDGGSAEANAETQRLWLQHKESPDD